MCVCVWLIFTLFLVFFLLYFWFDRMQKSAHKMRNAVSNYNNFYWFATFIFLRNNFALIMFCILIENAIQLMPYLCAGVLKQATNPTNAESVCMVRSSWEQRTPRAASSLICYYYYYSNYCSNWHGFGNRTIKSLLKRKS